MLSNKTGEKLNTYISDYVIFDLETTGTSCMSDAVVEISAVKVVNGKVVDEFSTLVNPLADYYGINTDGAHRALNDCRMNQQIFELLGKEMKNPSDAAKAVPKCPRCGNVLKKRDGRFGAFWGCTGYPDCKYTKNV